MNIEYTGCLVMLDDTGTLRILRGNEELIVIPAMTTASLGYLQFRCADVIHRRAVAMKEHAK